MHFKDIEVPSIKDKIYECGDGVGLHNEEHYSHELGVVVGS